MEVLLVIGTIILAIFIISSVTYSCRRINERKRLAAQSPVVVTTSTHRPHGYPVTMSTVSTVSASGQAMYPPVVTSGASGYHHHHIHHSAHSSAHQMNTSYPVSTTVMPMAGTSVGGSSAAQMNPPSYDSVVSAEGYQKQAPYNPGYPATSN